ncbi:hypothetical protein ACH5RR_008441 [Cinchona calisaya]|uniref:MAR-binding filament-like protein 1-1 n=1 Tax=Cinchona calisaya TaxID=153742 RepID=A0ABD3ABR8_9GENT
MASVPCSDINNIILCKSRAISQVGLSSFPFSQPKPRLGAFHYSIRDRTISQKTLGKRTSPFLRRELHSLVTKKVTTIRKSNISSNSSGSGDDDSSEQDKTPFGYTRKDVLLIGLGVTLFGVGLKSGLEFVGVDPLQAGNVVQLVLVLGLTVGWISTYIFRVSNKEMTYAQQLRDYESKVMEKRLESLTEAELQVLLEQVEEEKRQLAKGGEQGN